MHRPQHGGAMIGGSCHPQISDLVDIEATNACNAACLSCPRDKMQVPTRRIGVMTRETFLTLMDRYHEAGVSPGVAFCGMGEPLLHPLLPLLVTLAKGDRMSGKQVRIVTNGSLLSETMARRLADAGIDVITVSFPATDAVAYRERTGGLELDDLLANLRAARRVLGPQVVLTANVVGAGFSRAERRRTRAFLAGRGLTVVRFTRLHSRGGHLQSAARPVPPATAGCRVLAEINFIDWRGRVLSCCHDLAAENILGDLRQDTLAVIARRKQELLHDPQPFAICRACNDDNRYPEASGAEET